MDRFTAYPTPNLVGIELRVARVAARLRQADLAVLVSVPRPRISDWERGIRRPTADQATRLTAVLESLGASA